MPVHYTSIVAEHRATREAAGLFDVSHMGEISLEGPQAQALLDYLLPNPILSLEEGSCRYSQLCTAAGGVIDDLVVYRVAKEHYFLCVNAANTQKDLDWIQAHKAGFDCNVADVSSRYAQLAIQGPQAIAIVSGLTSYPVTAIKRFTCCDTEIASIAVFISRTGYTGEDGFEIYCAPEQAEPLALALYEAGHPLGLRWVGLGARDSLRLEAGLPLYGHELSESISPLQAGLERFLDLDKPVDFIGKAALLAERTAGSQKRILYFKLNDRRIARQGDTIFSADRKVGEVVSGTLSPMLHQPIGTALVDAKAIDARRLTVSVRRHALLLVKTQPPFYTKQPSRFYTETHEWVEIQGDTARVGITDFAQKILGDVTFVELPEVGSALETHAPFGVVESVKAASDLYAPLAGEIIETNQTLEEQPEIINTAPYESWMIKLKIKDASELQNLRSHQKLLTAQEYQNLILD